MIDYLNVDDYDFNNNINEYEPIFKKEESSHFGSFSPNSSIADFENDPFTLIKNPSDLFQENVEEKSTKTKTPEKVEELKQKELLDFNQTQKELFFLEKNQISENGFNFDQNEILKESFSIDDSSKNVIKNMVDQICHEEKKEIKKTEVTKTVQKFKTETKTKTKENIVRIDYLIKNLKVNSSQFMSNLINQLLEKYFPKKGFKVSKPNSKSFTSVTKAQKNLEFMGMKVKEILYLGKEKKDGSLQKNNFNVIQKIEKELDNGNELRDILEMSLENFYQEKFFNSSKFDEFCRDQRNIIIDEEFKKQRGFSLRSKGGFFKYLNEFK